MKKLAILFAILMALGLNICAFAESTHGKDGQVSAKSVGASLCSLIIWPGIGQAINGESADKNITHAVLGLTGVFRIWSFYDAIVDRHGGVWHNRI